MRRWSCPAAELSFAPAVPPAALPGGAPMQVLPAPGWLLLLLATSIVLFAASGFQPAAAFESAPPERPAESSPPQSPAASAADPLPSIAAATSQPDHPSPPEVSPTPAR